MALVLQTLLFTLVASKIREAVNANFTVIGLAQLGIKPESTAPEGDALTTQPSELLNQAENFF